MGEAAEEVKLMKSGVEEEEEGRLMMKKKKKKVHFVLIHGVGGGGWCWYKMKCLMESSGYMVTCVDLKGAGIDTCDPNSILSFDDYNQPLLHFLAALPSTDQHVILVGHSAGGLSVTDATHHFGNKITLAVYVAATMLKTGFSSLQDIKQGVPDLSEFGDAYDLEFGQGPEQPPTGARVKKELQRKIIYHMSPQEDSTLAGMLLRPGPIQALQSAQFGKVNEDDEDDELVEKVPRVYIKTTYDKVLKLEQQEAMINQWPPSKVYALDTDHSPFFSSPFLLFGLLVKAAAAFALPLPDE